MFRMRNKKNEFLITVFNIRANAINCLSVYLDNNVKNSVNTDKLASRSEALDSWILCRNDSSISPVKIISR